MKTEATSNHSHEKLVAVMSTPIVPLILNKNSRGIVHSVFNNGLNITWAEKLLHIGTIENGLSPFSIGLFKDDFLSLRRRVKLGDHVIWYQNSLKIVFPCRVNIFLEDVSWDTHNARRYTLNHQILNINYRYIINKLIGMEGCIGLAQTDEAYHQVIDYLQMSNDHQSLLVRKMLKLEALVNGVYRSSSVEIFDFWIGRGQGLTPSGDDVVIGLCAILSVMGRGDEQFWDGLRNYVRRKGAERTTRISFEYLTYAVRRQFHTHLNNLCQACLQKNKSILLHHLNVMINKGETSGVDTIIGMLIGMKSQFES